MAMRFCFVFAPAGQDINTWIWHGWCLVLGVSLISAAMLAAAVALAFEAQMVSGVPTAPHDANVDVLITARELLPCSLHGERVVAATASPA